MGRRSCCSKVGLNRGSWLVQEDKLLINYIKIHGEGKWRDRPERAGLRRCGKSCRLRWLNYLRPDIQRGNISGEEEDLIIRLHKLLGNRWSLNARRLPGRTDNEIKNYWNTNLSNRVGNCGMHNLRKSGNKKRGSKNYSMKFKQDRPTADEPHRVIRAKAVRCSKVVIPNPGLIENGKWDFGSENASPSAVQQGQDVLAGLLMDFDVNELLLPHALSSASPKAKKRGKNKVVGGDYNGLEDLSRYPDYYSILHMEPPLKI